MIDSITATVNSLSAATTALTDLVPKLIGFASISAAFLPKPKGKGTLSKLHGYLNMLAFNFKHATNK